MLERFKTRLKVNLKPSTQAMETDPTHLRPAGTRVIHLLVFLSLPSPVLTTPHVRSQYILFTVIGKETLS